MSTSILDIIKAKRAQLKAGQQGRTQSLKGEKNLVRILPNWAGDPNGTFFHDWGMHYVKDAKGVTKAVYICTQNTFGSNCAVCEALATAAASTEDETVLEAIKESRGSRRIIVNAMYLNGPQDNAKTHPVVLELPPSVFDQILSQAETYAAEGINIFDLAEGHNLIIEKKGSGRQTEYMVSVSPKSVAMPKEALERAKNLEEFAHQESDADLAKTLTAIRVTTGATLPSAAPAPRLVGPAAGSPAAGNSARLAAVDASAILDAEFEDVPDAKPAASRSKPATKAAETDDLDAILAELEG